MPEPKMQLEDWLDDLCVRFIINLPTEDLSSVARICFQVEEAQWFYEDFIRPLDPTLPSMSLRTFCLRIFQHCPLLASFSVENHMRAFEEFLEYKTRVPVRGAILLNEAMDSTVLVKGWKKGANWSFPRGKINKDEDDLDCAIREVYEETGFNIKHAGLVPKDEDVHYIEISIRNQQIRLYVFRNIPMDTDFQPKTRKEISAIEWYKLSELPAFRKKNNRLEDAAAAMNANKFYMVAPFLVPLKKWVVQQKKKDSARGVSHTHLPVHVPIEEVLTEDDIGTQPETQAQEDTPERIPAIETLEGATLELQRLLKVRPPTQGVQMSPSVAVNPDKGEALMAILQRKSANPPSQPSQQIPQTQPVQPFQNQVPHTPLDHTYTNPPEPNTPHYHHATHRLPVHNPPPPPNYPYAGGRGRSAPMQQYHFNFPVQGRVHRQSPGVNMGYGNQQFRKEPVLLHPQPLPPQVQQSILTRGILPTPNLPDTAGRNSAQQAHHASLLQAFVTQKPVPLPFQPHGGPQPHGGATAPQMTSHKMSLLNAFKTENRENSDPSQGTRDNVPQPTTQNQADPSRWSNTEASQAPNPAARYLPQNATVPLPQQPTKPAPHNVAPTAPLAAMPTPNQPSDQHRTSLLDMFKNPAPQSPPSNTSTVVPTQANDQHRASLLDMFSKTAPLSPPTGTSTETASQPVENPIFARKSGSRNPSYEQRVSSAAESSNGRPSQMNPEHNLPYRPVQILARPKQSDAGKARSPVSRSPAQHATNLPSPKLQSSLHITDTIRESIHGSNQMSPRLYQPASATRSPYGSLPQQQPNPVGAPASAQQPRRQESNPEQRQKLLSLFSKGGGQQSPTIAPGYEDKVATGKMKETGILLDQVRSGTPRSRVASLAGSSVAVGSVAGIAGEKDPSVGSGSKPSSRRGSQTPISPADRSFLLSYLQNVTSTGR